MRGEVAANSCLTFESGHGNCPPAVSSKRNFAAVEPVTRAEAVPSSELAPLLSASQHHWVTSMPQSPN
jgi:hypothetical protein